MKDSLEPGQRVRVRAPSSIVELRTPLGRIHDNGATHGFYIIHLDQPAIIHDVVDVESDYIVEHRDNLDVIDEANKSG